MNIFEVNKNTLTSLYERFPNSFEGLSLKDHYLKYDNQLVDISTFNINDLLVENAVFASSLDALSAIDIFTIIKLHVDYIGGIANES